MSQRCTVFDDLPIGQPMVVWEKYLSDIQAATSEAEALEAIKPLITDIVRFERFAVSGEVDKNTIGDLVVSEMTPTLEEMLLTNGPDLCDLSEKQIREEIIAAYFAYLEPSNHPASEELLSSSIWDFLEDL